MNGLVYAVGGFNGSLRVRTVDVYDPIKDMWSSVASMEARRSTLGSAILNGMIYAVGGFDGSSGELSLLTRRPSKTPLSSNSSVVFPRGLTNWLLDVDRLEQCGVLRPEEQRVENGVSDEHEKK